MAKIRVPRHSLPNAIILAVLMVGSAVLATLFQEQAALTFFGDLSSGTAYGTQNIVVESFTLNDTAPLNDEGDEVDEESRFDLVVWLKPPISANFSAEDFIVTRRYDSTHNMFLGGLMQVLKVDFRLCEPTMCPVNRTSTNATEELQQYRQRYQHLLQFQLNRATSLLFHQKTTQVVSRPYLFRGNLTLDDIEVVSFWNHEEQQHIHVQYENDAQHLIVPCDPDRGQCPPACPQNWNGSNPSPYPYLFDPVDKLCKSSDPSALPPSTLAAGKCRCESTCYTPEAVTFGTSFPWKSHGERTSFLSYVNDPNQTRMISNFQRASRARRQQLPFEESEVQFACEKPSNRGNLTIPDHIFGAMEWHLFYIPQAKLIFCGIPKVGISEWIKFFRYLFGAKDYLSLAHFKLDREEFFVNALPKSKAEELFNDPSWTQAVFVRDPYDRVLSAYLDKIYKGKHSQTAFNIGNNLPEKERPTLNFTDFVDLITNMSTLNDHKDPRGLKPATDPHWRPQYLTCGLDYLLPHFDFIGRLDRVAEHTKLLLEKVGLWEEYGATFDDGMDVQKKQKSSNMCWMAPPDRYPNETIHGFNQRGASKNGMKDHATGSSSMKDVLYTPEIREKIHQAYAVDFAIWDQVASSERAVDDIAHGKDLTVVRQYCSN